jgi:hypothetical protein
MRGVSAIGSVGARLPIVSMEVPVTRSPRSLDVGLGGVAALAGVAVAVSPSMTWLHGASRRSPWSGFGVFADREVLGIEGNALMLGIEDDGWYSSMFGPAAPMTVGVLLVVGGMAVTRQRPRVTPWIAPAAAVTALWSLGAAGITGGSGVVPSGGGHVGGAGICVWAIGSIVAALALGAKAARDRPRLSSSTVAVAVVDWAALPAIMLGGASAALFAAAEEVQPFATVLVLLAATFTAVFPAAATITALLAVTPPGRPLGVIVLNTSALVLAGLLFVLWAAAACDAGTGPVGSSVALSKIG